MQRTYKVLTGPTAAGKTAWLLARAQHVPLRVISADSRQVYRGMDIGTGKPTAAELAQAQHYGLDMLDPGQPYSAYEFVLDASRSLAALETFNGEIWVCGGTGLYIRTLVEGLPLGAPPRPRLRDALWPHLKERPNAIADDLAVKTKDRLNPHRVLRAIEEIADGAEGTRIYEYAGLDPRLLSTDRLADTSDYERARTYLSGWTAQTGFILDHPVTERDATVRRRVEAMFAGGLIEEVQRLRTMGFGGATVVAGGIGYAEAGAVLDGAAALSAAIDRAVIRTRQYAKRQRTYFKTQLKFWRLDWKYCSRESLDELNQV